VAQDIPRKQPVVGIEQDGQQRHAMGKPHARIRKNQWPVEGTPVAAGMQPPGFAPVTEEALQAIVHRLVTGLHPHKIVLFGSYVYGTPTADSDVDLLVIMDTQARPVDRYLCVSRLLRPRPFPLDLLVKTPEEVAQALDRNDAFIREIMDQGRVLYERSD
jgi:predicted nucleotidyltransferase